MDLLEQLKRDEGLRLKPYQDTVGKLTIGYGRNLDDVGISEEEAEFLLIRDVERTRVALYRRQPWLMRLDDARQGAVLNMALNLGVAGFLGFRRMLAALQRSEYDEAATEMLDSLWATQVGGRALRLAEQMRSGEWQ